VSRAIVAVTFDAAGTLFEVREAVGETYARHAQRLGFAVTPQAIEAGFRAAFAAAPPLAAPPPAACDPAACREFERAWWRAVVARSLAGALGDATRAARARSRRGGGSAQGRGSPQGGATLEPPTAESDASERLFEALFAHYASASAWRVADGAHGVLEGLVRRGLRIGVLSNFDGRLHGILRDLGLAPYVAAVIASSEAAAAKPSPLAFAAAARALGDPPSAASLHVGDSLAEDVLGALAAGWRAAWIAPPPRADADATAAVLHPPAGVTRLASLRDVVELVDAARA
jgi:putative hydrolase of the HAD superfamily